MVSIINEINKGLHESTGLFALAELPNDKQEHIMQLIDMLSKDK